MGGEGNWVFRHRIVKRNEVVDAMAKVGAGLSLDKAETVILPG